MAQPAPTPSGLRQGGFERTCVYCGARFRVELTRRARDDGLRDYACPECGKRYEIAAVLPPVVNIIARRSDGKNDRYQETMF